MQAAFNTQTELQRREVSRRKVRENELDFRRTLWDTHDRRGGQPPHPGSCLVCGAQHALADCQKVCLQLTCLAPRLHRCAACTCTQ